MLNQTSQTAPPREAALSKTTDLIKLTPPLPWLSEQGYAGFVQSLGLDRLHLYAAPGSSDGCRLERITVSLPEGTAFLLSGSCQVTNKEWIFTVIAQDQAKLHELISQLRKDQHIELCAHQDVEASDRFTGFSRLNFIPEALPLIDQADLDLQCKFLGRTFSAPLLITGMTGGIHKGHEINRRLAQTAARFNIPMGLGSQRIALENADYAEIFKVKAFAPGLFLIGNIGMAQLTGSNALELCRRAVDMIEADALAIHFNLVQECIQVEGDRRFSGFLQQLAPICANLGVPIIAKEVGCGITPQSVQRLRDLGIAAIDIGGKGGTSWSHIEGLRSNSARVQNLGSQFRDWGIPTAYSLAAVHEACPGFPIIATGGIRDGLTIAKAVALGASMAGIGLPLLRAALASEDAPRELIASYCESLALTMQASGCRTLPELAKKLTLGLPLEREFARIFGG